jgi:hypothetical protein
VNATTPIEPYADLGACPISGAARQAARNLHALSAALMATTKVGERLRDDLAANAATALGDQITAAHALAKAKSPQEAFDLHQLFARRTFEACAAHSAAVSVAFAAAFESAVRPLSQMMTEASGAV